jgi:predicted amidohydrolase
MKGPVLDKAKVAAVNFEPIQGDREATFAKMRAALDKAAAQGCDLAVFPEMAFHGFVRCPDCKAQGQVCDAHFEEAELASGPLIQRLAEIVRAHDMYAVIGFAERDPHRRAIYNAAAVLGPEGLLGTSRKMGNGTYAFMHSPGEELRIYQTRFGPMGVGICYDIWMNPELARLLVLRGARLLAVPTATVPTTNDGELEKMAFARSRENMVFLAVANLLRRVPGKELVGYSVIAGPQHPSMGVILARDEDPNSMVVADIDFGEYERYAEEIPIRKRRRNQDLMISEYVAREFAALAQPIEAKPAAA